MQQKNFYLLIAGSRTYNNYEELTKITNALLVNFKSADIHIVSGGAKGADALAKKYAIDNNFAYHEFPANWNQYGKAAGYIRNKQMHDFISQFPCRGCLCFWDGQSRGTAQNFSLAAKAKTPLRIYNYCLQKFVKENT